MISRRYTRRAIPGIERYAQHEDNARGFVAEVLSTIDGVDMAELLWRAVEASTTRKRTVGISGARTICYFDRERGARLGFGEPWPREVTTKGGSWPEVYIVHHDTW